MDRQRLRNAIGGHDLEPHVKGVTDNLAIALCGYFKDHYDRPANDPETDDHSWGEWVEAQTNRVLDELTDSVIKLLV